VAVSIANWSTGLSTTHSRLASRALLVHSAQTGVSLKVRQRVQLPMRSAAAVSFSARRRAPSRSRSSR